MTLFLTGDDNGALKFGAEEQCERIIFGREVEMHFDEERDRNFHRPVVGGAECSVNILIF